VKVIRNTKTAYNLSLSLFSFPFIGNPSNIPVSMATSASENFDAWIV
jgi:hypothetical protein